MDPLKLSLTGGTLTGSVEVVHDGETTSSINAATGTIRGTFLETTGNIEYGSVPTNYAIIDANGRIRTRTLEQTQLDLGVPPAVLFEMTPNTEDNIWDVDYASHTVAEVQSMVDNSQSFLAYIAVHLGVKPTLVSLALVDTVDDVLKLTGQIVYEHILGMITIYAEWSEPHASLIWRCSVASIVTGGSHWFNATLYSDQGTPQLVTGLDETTLTYVSGLIGGTLPYLTISGETMDLDPGLHPVAEYSQQPIVTGGTYENVSNFHVDGYVDTESALHLYQLSPRDIIE